MIRFKINPTQIHFTVNKSVTKIKIDHKEEASHTQKLSKERSNISRVTRPSRGQTNALWTDIRDKLK
jgi:hypothetical protein